MLKSNVIKWKDSDFRKKGACTFSPTGLIFRHYLNHSEKALICPLLLMMVSSFVWGIEQEPIYHEEIGECAGRKEGRI